MQPLDRRLSVTMYTASDELQYILQVSQLAKERQVENTGQLSVLQ